MYYKSSVIKKREKDDLSYGYEHSLIIIITIILLIVFLFVRLSYLFIFKN